MTHILSNSAIKMVLRFAFLLLACCILNNIGFAQGSTITVAANSNYFTGHTFNTMSPNSTPTTGTLAGQTFSITRSATFSTDLINSYTPGNLPTGIGFPSTVPQMNEIDNGTATKTINYIWTQAIPLNTHVLIQDYDQTEAGTYTFYDCSGSVINPSNFGLLKVSTGTLPTLTFSATNVSVTSGSGNIDEPLVGIIIKSTSVCRISNALTIGPGGTIENYFSAQPTKVTLTKTSVGGTGTFNFTGTNGFGSDSIITATAGTGKVGTTKNLTASNTSTEITESTPTGYSLTGISCTGLGTGGIATYDLVARKVTLDALATPKGAEIACTFTNAKTALLAITKSSNGPWTVGQSGAQYSLVVTNSGNASTTGTTTVLDVLPTGITANWTGTRSVISGGITWSCTFSGATVTCTTTGALSSTAGSNTSTITLPVNVTTSVAVGTNSITNYASTGGGGDPYNSGSAPTPSSTCIDTSHCTSNQTTVNSPDLTIAKSHTPTNFIRGGTGTYNITVSNGGTAATSGTVTVSDSLPTGLSIADGTVTLSGTNSTNWSCTAASNVITCTSTTAIATSGSSVFSFVVNVAVKAAASVTNNANVSGGGEATANNGNNSTTDLTNTVLPPSFGCTDKGYAIKNAATIAEFWEIDIATGTSNQLISSIIPSSLGAQGANSIGYNPLDGLVYGKRIGSAEIIRIASDLSVQIIPISGLPTGNLFAADVSSNGIYYLTRTGNTTIERVDVNPSSLTYMTRLSAVNVPTVNYSDIAINSIDGFGYAVTDGAAPHSLLRINLISGATTTIGTVTGGGSESVNTTFGGYWMDSQGNLYINHGGTGNTFRIAGTHLLSPGAVTSTFVSTATTGINDGAKCNTSNVVLGPDLTIAKSHIGNFTVGSNGTYSFSVTNGGETSSSGTITVSDTLPVGLTVNGGAVGGITEGGANAANWTCNSAALTGTPARQTITCTSSNAIAVSGTSVFNFAVNVGAETVVGTNSITNTATVAGGGETDTTNNSASNPTTVLAPDLTIAKSHTGNFTRGSTGTYTINVGNSGTAATSGTVSVSDTLPSGLTIADGAVSLSGTNSADWSCTASSNVITCTSTTAIATSGSSIFSFVVNVASNAAATVTNTATVSGGNEATANNGNNSSSDPTNTISSPPNVTLAKSCTVPANCTTAAQNPGTDVTYKIVFTNSGGQGAVNMAIVDAIPTNTDFKLASVTTDAGTTGLTIVIEYSSNYDPSDPPSANWTYTPVSGGSGASVGYDRNVKAIRWRTTSGTLSNVSPNNTGSVSFVTKIR